MSEGTVKFFNEAKEFGFIKDKNISKEYFVRLSDCIDTIQENDNVQFELRDGPRGLSAINVKIKML
jgi:CspA family cold shock protein